MNEPEIRPFIPNFYFAFSLASREGASTDRSARSNFRPCHECSTDGEKARMMEGRMRNLKGRSSGKPIRSSK